MKPDNRENKVVINNSDADAMFAGVIGQEYQLLKKICPFAPELSRLVGLEVSKCCHGSVESRFVVELGGGTGITTLSILSASNFVNVLSVDIEPVMQNQAKQSLQNWVDEGRLRFCLEDALTALNNMADDSVDILASAYTLHNFEASYRKQVLHECYRVLKPGGCFVNGDRYALDDINLHIRNTQQEVARYFDVLTEIKRLDLLKQWVIHLFNDESENHIMRESVALKALRDSGFRDVRVELRRDVDALITAVKH